LLTLSKPSIIAVYHLDNDSQHPERDCE